MDHFSLEKISLKKIQTIAVSETEPLRVYKCFKVDDDYNVCALKWRRVKFRGWQIIAIFAWDSAQSSEHILPFGNVPLSVPSSRKLLRFSVVNAFERNHQGTAVPDETVARSDFQP